MTANTGAATTAAARHHVGDMSPAHSRRSARPNQDQLRRTAEYKIKPIKAEVRCRLGYPHPQRVPNGVFAEMAIGISLEEIGRARDADVRYMRNTFPLLDLGWRRGDCLQFLREHGLADTPRSSCVGCLMRNWRTLVCAFMTVIEWARYPLLADHEHGRRWLQFTANIGRAPNTIDAYGRAAEDHLRYCRREGLDPLTTKADAVAGWIGDLRERPDPRSAKVVHLDSGAGLANATIQQRPVLRRRHHRRRRPSTRPRIPGDRRQRRVPRPGHDPARAAAARRRVCRLTSNVPRLRLRAVHRRSQSRSKGAPQ